MKARPLKMKNTLDSNKGRLNITEKKNSELEDTAIELR